MSVTHRLDSVLGPDDLGLEYKQDNIPTGPPDVSRECQGYGVSHRETKGIGKHKNEEKLTIFVLTELSNQRVRPSP